MFLVYGGTKGETLEVMAVRYHPWARVSTSVRLLQANVWETVQWVYISTWMSPGPSP